MEGRITMPHWNHNCRRDLYDSFIDDEIINGADDAAPSENERLNGTIRYIIQNNVTLHPGCEVYCQEESMGEVIESLENGDVLPMGHRLAVQVNAYSLAETDNEGVRDFARRLLQEKLVTFIGSDTHGTGHRPVSLASGVRYIHETCDGEYAADV